jgi:predicted aminopeptidase
LLKLKTIECTRKQYQALKKQWRGYTGYDNWFKGEINNARLSSIGTYHRFVPAFRKLLAREKTLEGFYLEAEKLAKMEKTTRHKTLDDLLVSASQ